MEFFDLIKSKADNSCPAIRRAQFVVGPHFFSTLLIGKTLNRQTFFKTHARGSAFAVEPTTHWASPCADHPRQGRAANAVAAEWSWHAYWWQLHPAQNSAKGGARCQSAVVTTELPLWQLGYYCTAAPLALGLPYSAFGATSALRYCQQTRARQQRQQHSSSCTWATTREIPLT